MHHMPMLPSISREGLLGPWAPNSIIVLKGKPASTSKTHWGTPD